MRLFVAILVLILSIQSWTKADDISDFEIESMSIGDSLLSHFTKEKIEKNIRPNVFERFSDKTFVLSEIQHDSKFEVYDTVQFIFKRYDKEFQIYGMTGGIWYEENISACYDKMKEITRKHMDNSSMKKEITSFIDGHDFTEEEKKYLKTITPVSYTHLTLPTKRIV